jgi:hypothetical protein
MIDAEGFVAALAGPGRPTDATVDGLADLWPVLPDRLRWALSAAGADVDEWEALELAVRIGERLSTRAWLRDLFGQGTDDAVLWAHLDLRRESQDGLTVEPADLLDRLPLVALANDVASRTAGGRLRVELADASRITGLWGCLSKTTRGDVILLSVELSDAQLAEIFAHELAHALDSDSGRIDEFGREAFAEDLAPRLLAELPDSVAAAGELVEASLRAVQGSRRAVPSSDSLADLLEWALAEVCVDWVHLDLIAAHRAPGPGVNALPADTSFPRPVGEGQPEGSSPGPAVPASGPGAFGGEC